MNNFGQVAEHKINIQKQQYFYLLAMNIKNKIKETIPFTIILKD